MVKEQNILITICARGGSKGIPQKNIRLLDGQPLIQYTYNHAKAFAEWLKAEYDISSVIALSTDSEEIQNTCETFGFTTTYTRPDYLASDTAGKLDAIKDVLLFTEGEKQVQFDFILDLDVSAPMRTKEDLRKGFIQFFEDNSIENTYSVSPAHKNPYFNMVEENADGYFELSKRGDSIMSRQKAPAVYEMNASFYFYRRAFYTKPKLYLFDKSKVYVMKHLSFDLDHIDDFDYLEYLLKEKKLSFEL